MEFNQRITQTLRDKILNYINERPDLFDEHPQSDENSNFENVIPLAASAKFLPTHGEDLAMRQARDEFLKRFGKNWSPIDQMNQINKKRLTNLDVKLSEEACVAEYDLEALICQASYFGDNYKACMDRAEDNYNNCTNNGNHGGRGIITFEELNGQAQHKADPERKRGGTKRELFNFRPLESAVKLSSLAAPMIHMHLKSLPSKNSSQDLQRESVDRFLKQITLPTDTSPYGTPSSVAPYMPPPWLLPMLLGGGL